MLELVSLESSFGVIEVYIEGAPLGDGNIVEDYSKSDDSDIEPEQDPLKVSLKSAR